MKTGRQVVVIAGPTASGESTFTREFVLAYPNFAHAVSATTRPPRGTEEDGVDYYFFSKEAFFEKVQSGEIPEHTFVKERDAHYGTYLPDLRKKIESGKTVIVNTDLKGAQYFKEHYHAITIFIKPKSMYTLYERLLRRDPTISREEVIVRLLNASQEILGAEHQYDYTVFNDDGEFAETMIKIQEILKREGYDV
jgi:guanylate kinase